MKIDLRGITLHPVADDPAGMLHSKILHLVSLRPQRFAEAKEALDEFARSYTGYLLSLDPETVEGLNDLHMLFGALCALAELQAALPGRLTARTPLKLVLDRRPFI